MQTYYKELLKYSPRPIVTTDREVLKKLWPLEEYLCTETFLDFYECFQADEATRKAFYNILPVEQIHIKNNGIIFAMGHQNAYPLGIEMSDLIYDSPRVKYQTSDTSQWYNESGSLKSFLFGTSGWQIINEMSSVARIEMDIYEFEKTKDKLFEYFSTEKKVNFQSRYCLCQNVESDILGCFVVSEDMLYLGAKSDDILNDFEEKHQLDLDWL